MFSIGHVALALTACLTIAMFLGAIWPINLLGIARKVVSRTIALCAAFTSFAFVTAAATGSLYRPATAYLRAEIARDFKALVKARQHGAALRLIDSVIVKDIASQPAAVSAW